MPFEVMPILPVTGGQKEDQPKQLIDNIFSPEMRDVIYSNGKIETRAGLSKEYADDLLNPIKEMKVYETFTGDEILIKFTTKDIYQLDASNNKPLFLNPTYTTGTITVTNGSTTITGAGTLWDTTVDGRKNARAGDIIRLGSINGASPIFYEIASITSDTVLEKPLTIRGHREEKHTPSVKPLRRLLARHGELQISLMQLSEILLSQ